MEKQKGQKTPLSVKEWTFSIVGIIFLTSLMVLPPLFRIFFAEDEFTPTLTPPPISNEDKKPEPSSGPIDMSKYDQMICIKDSEGTGDPKITRTFAYQNNELKVYVETTERRFSQEKEVFDIEEGKEGSCSLPPKEYLKVPGFEYQCQASNSLSETLIHMENKFDLKNFSDTTITVGEEVRVISVSYYLDQNVDAIKNNLEAQNYSCHLESEQGDSNEQ
ncbi:MAG: hypothetical protein HFG40_03020 [Bacilli bacterium]|nr:hypothetical protein [Bacilli bacterium]